MGYSSAQPAKTHDRQGFWPHRPGPTSLRNFLGTHPVTDSAFCISNRALFLTRLDVVACGDTSEKCREAPKLTEIFAVFWHKCAQQKRGSNHEEIRRPGLCHDAGHVRDRAAGEPSGRTDGSNSGVPRERSFADHESGQLSPSRRL